MASGEHNQGASSSKRSVDSILRSLVGPSQKTSSLGVAQQEATHSLRKKSRATTRKGKLKHSGKKYENDSEGWFKVIVIGVNTDGVAVGDNDELVLVNDHSPSKYKLQIMALRHLAHIDESGIAFGLSWTFDQVNEKLRQLFPELFEYLDSLSPNTDPNLDDKPLAPWLLCFRQQNTLKLVPDLFPTGHVLDFNKGTTRAGFQQSNVFIATRVPVPAFVINSWSSKGTSTASPFLGLPSKDKGKGKASDQRLISLGSRSRTNKKRSAISSDESSESSEASENEHPPRKKQSVTTRSMMSDVKCTFNVEDGPVGSSEAYASGLVVEDAMASTIAGTTTSASESANTGSSTAPILIDIPLNDDGTMGPVNPVDHGSPLPEPDFPFNELQSWSPPPSNAILHPVTPPPSAVLPDPTFSFSPQTSSQNPWKADRTFEF